MKLKKFFMTFACFVLVVAAALGFSGCAKTTNVDAEKAIAYVQQANIGEKMANGYKMNLKMLGENASAVVILGENPQAYMKASDGALYYKDGYVYINTGTTGVGKKKIQFALDDDPDDVPMAYKDYVESVSELFAEDNDQVSVEQWMNYITQMLGNDSLKATKTVDGNETTYTLSGSVGAGRAKVTYEISFTFTNKKFTSMTMDMMSGVMVVNVAPYSGTINFPDFSGYQEVALS